MHGLIGLLEEIHVSPPDPKTTWITTNEPNSGLLGFLSQVSAEDASRPPAPGMKSIAAHTQHLIYCITLANRAARGEDAYAGADWAASWRTDSVTAMEWEKIRDSLRHEHELLIAAIKDPAWREDPMLIQGMMALIGHGAYHLGAIRQIRRMLAAADS